MDNTEKILEKLQKLEISQAVTHEKLDNMNKTIKEEKDSLEALEKRVDRHDKIVGAVVIAVAILSVLVKFKLI